MGLKLHNFHHANTGAEIIFVESQIFYFYYSPAHKATHLVSIGGAYAPIRESVEEVSTALSAESNKETNNHG